MQKNKVNTFGVMDEFITWYFTKILFTDKISFFKELLGDNHTDSYYDKWVECSSLEQVWMKLDSTNRKKLFDMYMKEISD